MQTRLGGSSSRGPAAAGARRPKRVAAAARRARPLLDDGGGGGGAFGDAEPPSSSQRVVTLCVEGNIGAGKSTFLGYVSSQARDVSGAHVAGVPEPVHMWQSVGGGGGGGGGSSAAADDADNGAAASPPKPINLLDEFYKDPKGMAFTFQSYVFLTRVLQERDSRGLPPPLPPSSAANANANANATPHPHPPPTQRVRLLERSVFSDRLVFVRAVRAAGWMTPADLAVYDAYAEALVGLAPESPGPLPAPPPPLVPDGFVYLRSRPAVCAERLARRARSEEGGVSLEYLEQLHALHEDWLGAGVGLEEEAMVRREAGQAGGGGESEGGGGGGSGAAATPPTPPPPSIRNNLRFLPDPSARAAGGELHPVLAGVPALVLDADADALRDPSLQKEAARQVADFARWLAAARAGGRGRMGGSSGGGTTTCDEEGAAGLPASPSSSSSLAAGGGAGGGGAGGALEALAVAAAAVGAGGSFF